MQEKVYRQVFIYTKFMFLKKLRKSNTKFPFKTVYFLEVR